MLTVHHLGISQSDRIVWLCEELGLPYDLVRYDRDAVTRLAPADYRALTPFGTAPVITDGDLTLGESAAIIDYIVARYADGRLTVGKDAPNFTDYLYWFHFANGSFMPTMMTDLIVKMVGDGAIPDLAKVLASRGARAYAQIEQRLGETIYFAGPEFTAADIMMLFPLTTGRMFVPRDLAPFPNIRAYLQRIGARPAFQTAMAKADPDLAPMLT
ncbi:glutathione S-transferase family protein [Sphingomonas sp.]|uniref:glutathione S-transferase family protein n=1 Tax=Sphingomonas sp. TaxID=28214 RepID=UPI003753D5D6